MFRHIRYYHDNAHRESIWGRIKLNCFMNIIILENLRKPTPKQKYEDIS